MALGERRETKLFPENSEPWARAPRGWPPRFTPSVWSSGMPNKTQPTSKDFNLEKSQEGKCPGWWKEANANPH